MKDMKQHIVTIFNRRSKTKAYGEKQVKHILIVTVPLIIVGLLMEFGYYSTIGGFGNEIAYRIVKDHGNKILVITVLAICMDLGLAYLKGVRFKSLLNMIKVMSGRPALAYTLIFLLTLSFDVPMSALMIGTLAIVLCSQNTKIGYSYYAIHPVLIGYILGVLAILISNNKLGIYQVPSVLSAPFSVSVSGPLLFTLEDFQLKYYSFKTILFGLYESSLSFNLMIPLVIAGLFLIKRQVIDFKVSGVFILIYSILSISYHQGAGLESWILPLQFINGSFMFCAVFLVGDVVTLPTRTIFKYAYITGTAILTFIMTYYVHFVLGPYLAVFISQVIVFVIRLVNLSVLPSIKVQLTK